MYFDSFTTIKWFITGSSAGMWDRVCVQCLQLTMPLVSSCWGTNLEVAWISGYWRYPWGKGSKLSILCKVPAFFCPNKLRHSHCLQECPLLKIQGHGLVGWISACILPQSQIYNDMVHYNILRVSVVLLTFGKSGFCLHFCKLQNLRHLLILQYNHITLGKTSVVQDLQWKIAKELRRLRLIVRRVPADV